MDLQVHTKDALKYIDQIQQLGDTNSKTLGFLPGEAYKELARNRCIYYILDSNRVVAYVLFRCQKINNAIVLTHLCVTSEYRKTGAAKKLVDTVKEEHPHHRYIEARCRRDYNLNNFWKNCGFHVETERAGRMQTGSVLTIWRRGILEKDLLSLIYEKESENKVVAVLDTNIVIELFNNEKATMCLKDSYLDEYVLFRISPECKDEINKHSDDDMRKRVLAYASQYDSIRPGENLDDTISKLTALYDPNHQNTADIRHLAHCVASVAEVFVTRDDWLCKHRKSVYDIYGIEILRPEELYLEIEEIFESTTYAPEKMLGSKYSEAPLRSVDLSKVAYLHEEAGCKKKAFEKMLLSELMKDDVEVYAIRKDDDIIGLYALEKNQSHYLLTQFLFSSKKLRGTICNTLMRYMLNRIVQHISKKETSCISVMVSNEVVGTRQGVFSDCGFIPTIHYMIHIVLNAALSKADALASIEQHLNDLKASGGIEETQKVLDTAELVKYEPLLFEQIFYPTILRNTSELPVYIIPIRPKYAVRLFDEELSNANPSFLDNQHESAALSIESSYYSATKQHFAYPCRILWYVSEDERYYGAGAIRACSIMTEVSSGCLKELYKKHRKYGVLEWQEVGLLLDKKPYEKIQVFSFDCTNNFRKHMKFGQLEKLFLEITGKHVQLAGPLKISQVLFENIIDYCMEA